MLRNEDIMRHNRIIDTDSYKASHYSQYPKGATSTFSYIESRGCKNEGWNETVFFGLQYILNEYFKDPITMEEVEEAKVVIEAHGMPFNYEGWKTIVEKYDGYLPLRIRAVPEGTIVPLHNVLMTVETTADPEDKLFWVASYFETVFMRVWYPITVASQSYQLRKLIYSYLAETSDNPDAEISFKLHDFGSRGVSSQESAMIGGAAHLLSFMGTDTMVALTFLRKYYGADMAGFSIPAGEHSTFSSWGKDHEVDAYRNMLKTFGREDSLLAVVSDTWDIYNACENIWGEQLRQEVIDSGATVVIRPDSGDPIEVLCGISTKDLLKEDGKYYVKGKYNSYKDMFGAEVWGDYDKGKEVKQGQIKGILRILEDKFGVTINSKGYKVLNNVRVIQGDGVNPDSIAQILKRMKELGFSASNIAFGMGGALLQKVDRDTFKFAYKCSSITINGVEQDVYKDPITDSGKRSKRGRLDLIQLDSTAGQTVNEAVTTFKLEGGNNFHPRTKMVLYYQNGEIYNTDTLESIRKRLLTN